MPDRLRLILGAKLRALRHERGLSLKALAKKAEMSVSYLSEIEQGKKYPKPDKLIDLSHALRVPYDDLVSLRMDKGMDAVKEAIESPLVQQFPFELFGIEPQEVLRLLAGVPEQSAALVRAVGEVTRAYDARVEHFLFAALRAHQQAHRNHFPELERVADRLRQRVGATTPAALREHLESAHGYTIDTETLPGHPDLGRFRSVFARRENGPTLFVNGALSPEQLAFLFARELGFLALGSQHRPATSSWLRVESFEQVKENFEASYVAGAMLLPANEIDRALEHAFAQPTWNPEAMMTLLARFGATPEMLFYRLTERLPEALGLDDLFFLRFHHPQGADDVTLTKTFNLSDVPVPHGVEGGEHYCRRWPAMQALADLDRAQARAAGAGDRHDAPVIRTQRSHFVGREGASASFWTVAIARPLALRPDVNAAVSLGVKLDRASRRRVGFADDPRIPDVDVGLTCERCPIRDCRVRSAPASVLDARTAQARRERALDALIG